MSLFIWSNLNNIRLMLFLIFVLDMFYLIHRGLSNLEINEYNLIGLVGIFIIPFLIPDRKTAIIFFRKDKELFKNLIELEKLESLEK
jgi:hypothetical protein